MIKILAPAQRHPSSRTLAQFHAYWGETHGPLFANTSKLQRYVQHLTLPESYDTEPMPTFDGCSMFWYEDLDARLAGRTPDAQPQAWALFQAVVEDDRQLFDRSTEWPTHWRRAYVAAEEHIILDGPTAPDMVKAILIVGKIPGLSLEEFFEYWRNDLGPRAAELPGLKRYVQNHGIADARATQQHTHDGWSELWFDDVGALQRAARSREWRRLEEDGTLLFGQPRGVVVARERVQKDLDWTYNDFGVTAMSEETVLDRLVEQGYTSVAADPEAPRRIKSAAANKALAVWTHEHLVTIDESRIDARPER